MSEGDASNDSSDEEELGDEINERDAESEEGSQENETNEIIEEELDSDIIIFEENSNNGDDGSPSSDNDEDTNSVGEGDELDFEAEMENLSHVSMKETKTKRNERELQDFPESSLFMRLCFPCHLIFIWLIPLLWKGFWKPLKMSSLPKISNQYKCSTYEKSFGRVWKLLEFLGCCHIRLMMTLYVIFFPEYFLSGFMKLISAILAVIVPLFLAKFLENLQPLLDDEEMARITESSILVPSDLRVTTSDYEDNYRDNNYDAWLWLIALCFAQTATFVLQNYSYFLAARVGCKMRVLLNNLIYKKIFSMSNRCLEKRNKGAIFTLLASDCVAIDQGHVHLHEVWTAIVKVGFSCYFLVTIMGVEVLFSFLLFTIVLVLMLLTLMALCVFRMITLKVMDRRNAHLKETFNYILQVKFYSRERIQKKKIWKYRNRELLMARILYFLRTIVFCLAYATSPMMLITAYSIYYAVNGGEISNVVLLTSITYFTMLRTPLVDISINFTSYLNTVVSMRRVQLFLEEKERPKKKKEESSEKRGLIMSKKEEKENESEEGEEIELEDQQIETKEEEKISIQVKGSFHFSATKKTKDPFVLKNLDISIPEGSLVLLIGATRSGKSTFVRTLLSETDPLKEDKNSPDSFVKIKREEISYCDQTVWLENNTIRNIITRPNEKVDEPSKYHSDQKRLNDILRVCALEEEINRFPGGLDLEIAGPNSESISGGQKSRIALCRAVYNSAAKIFLFDTSFSALDEFLANHVFQYCVLRYLHNKTRVVVTNKWEYLPYADDIIVLDEGEVIERGTFDQLYEKRGKMFELIEGEMYVADDPSKYDIESLLNTKQQQNNNNEDEEVVMVTEKEERKTGIISRKTMKTYISYTGCCGKSCLCGCCVIVLVYLLYVLFVGNYFLNQLHISYVSNNDYYMEEYGNSYHSPTCNISTSFKYCDISESYWISYNTTISNYSEPTNESVIEMQSFVSLEYNDVDIFWNSDYQNETVIRNGISEIQGLGIYGGLLVTFIMLFFIGTMCFLNTFLSTSKRMFYEVTERLLSTHVSFFFTNPAGRIISRLTHDVVRMDSTLVVRAEFLSVNLIFVLGAFCQILISTYGIFLPVVVVSVVGLLCIYAVFRKTAIELKRIDSIARSRIFNLFNQTLTGLTTIRSFPGDEARWARAVEHSINEQTRASILLQGVKNMLRTYLTCGGIVTLFVVCVLAIIFSFYTEIDGVSSLFGLGVINMNLIVDIAGSIFYNCVMFETQMNSVERIGHYIDKLQGESEFHPTRSRVRTRNEIISKEPQKAPSKDFKIQHPTIRFCNFSAKYIATFPNILNDVSLDIEENDKILVIGETGCGKSSLFNALLGIFDDENMSGEIFVDGRNILEIANKRSLRREISIISQDPILFSGTLRENLDPMNVYKDEEIVSILKLCDLDNSNLDAPVLENGKNFSVGEKRLFCLARALVMGSKIVMLDDCIGVDCKLDKLSQKIVVGLSDSSCCRTVMSISHRLSHLEFFEKVLIMSEGRVKEFGFVKDLMMDQESNLSVLLGKVPTGQMIKEKLRMKYSSTLVKELESEEEEVVGESSGSSSNSSSSEEIVIEVVGESGSTSEDEEEVIEEETEEEEEDVINEDEEEKLKEEVEEEREIVGEEDVSIIIVELKEGEKEAINVEIRIGGKKDEDEESD